MPSILALPPAAAQLISSSQAITDIPSLVKELVDNAIDALAKSVFIEISPNSLDLLQVKDDGHGFSPDDRSAIGKRGWTSKIRDLDDLQHIGQRGLLGFRGQALASCAEMARTMTVLTKVEGEPTGVALNIGKCGTIEMAGRVAHPVGTTVRVAGFLSDIPVRRQVAIKSCTKSLANIKRMLQSYALARPEIRFSFKISKSTKEGGNWIYVPPKSAPCLKYAALKVASTQAVDECMMIERTLRKTDGNLEVIWTIEIQALLPKPIADFSKVNGSGHFISVDRRPMACRKGTLKRIVGLFRSHIRLAPNPGSSNTKASDPFICMNMNFPPRSYDPNIEPAKDDVLFEDPELVVHLIGAFFADLYGSLQTPDQVLVSQHNFQNKQQPPNQSNSLTKLSPAKKRQFHIFNRESDEERPSNTNFVNLQRETSAIESLDSENVSNINISNPWTIAKINAPIRPLGNCQQLCILNKSQLQLSLQSVVKPLLTQKKSPSQPKADFQIKDPKSSPFSDKRKIMPNKLSEENLEANRRNSAISAQICIDRTMDGISFLNGQADSMSTLKPLETKNFSRGFVSARGVPVNPKDPDFIQKRQALSRGTLGLSKAFKTPRNIQNPFQSLLNGPCQNTLGISTLPCSRTQNESNQTDIGGKDLSHNKPANFKTACSISPNSQLLAETENSETAALKDQRNISAILKCNELLNERPLYNQDLIKLDDVETTLSSDEEEPTLVRCSSAKHNLHQRSNGDYALEIGSTHFSNHNSLQRQYCSPAKSKVLARRSFVKKTSLPESEIRPISLKSLPIIHNTKTTLAVDLEQIRCLKSISASNKTDFEPNSSGVFLAISFQEASLLRDKLTTAVYPIAEQMLANGTRLILNLHEALKDHSSKFADS
ncbi:MAG: hypothetical protein M1829_001395 [Trizodia sp. TS-e1964]|nr:MAG: hypothetical protein M1829_001395 [Trizodia sp. TS-e1964]